MSCGVVTITAPEGRTLRRVGGCPRAWRHINQQNVEITPQRFLQQLRHRQLAIGPRHTMGVLAELK